MQALQAVGGEALPPLADGVAVAAQLGGDVPIGGAIVRGGAEDDATAEGQRLRRGAGADEGLELVPDLLGQLDGRTEGAWHGWPPGEQDRVVVPEDIMGTHAPVG